MRVYLFIAGITLLTACSIREVNTLEVSPSIPDDLSSISVEYKFYGDADGTTDLVFAENWGPETKLSALVSDFKVTGGQRVDKSNLNGAGQRLSITHTAKAFLGVGFTIKQDYKGEPQWGVQRVPGMRPVLQRDYATIIGHTVFPQLEATPDRTFEVSFTGFSDKDMTTFSHLLDEKGRSKPLTNAQIRNSILTLGQFSYAENNDSKVQVRTSIRGIWPISDLDFRTITSTVLRQASILFEDRAFEQYYVALNAMPSLPEGSAVIGTALEESFFILATPNADATNLQHTIIHEVLHEWITRRMGETDESSDPMRMWFTEGITEYYTQLILLQSDRISLLEFLNGMNELSRNYQASSVNTLPILQLANRLWESRETERLPYQRGALLAFHWDTISRSERNGSLADALIRLINDAEMDRERNEPPVLTDKKILAALSEVVGPRFDADYERFLKNGGLINLADLRVPSCISTVKDEDGIICWAPSQSVKQEDCVAVITAPP